MSLFRATRTSQPQQSVELNGFFATTFAINPALGIGAKTGVARTAGTKGLQFEFPTAASTSNTVDFGNAAAIDVFSGQPGWGLFLFNPGNSANWSGSTNYIANKSDANITTGWTLSHTTAGLVTLKHVNASSNKSVTSVSAALQSDKWVVLIYDHGGSTTQSDGSRFFIDGIDVTAGSGTGIGSHPTDSNLPLRLGLGAYGGTYSSVGKFALAAFGRKRLSNAEIKSLSDNPWQIFQPTNRAIYPEAAGGGGTGNATGSLASITIDAATGTATGKATATATPASVSITAPIATATGGAVGNATGALSSVTLAGPSATASGKAQATTTPASVTLVSPTATATGKGQASGALAAVSLVAPTGTASASAGGAGNAVASPASITIAAPGATATGAAAAFASFMSVVLTPVSGTASSGAIQVAGAVTRGRRTQDFGRTRRIANTTR